MLAIVIVQLIMNKTRPPNNDIQSDTEELDVTRI